MPVIGLPVLFLCVCLWGCFTGQLYFGVPNARVEYDGSVSEAGKYYRAGNGLAIVSLDVPETRNQVYVVQTDITGKKYIGEFLGESPDDNILQFRNPLFATCVSPMIYVGMDDGYDGSERIHDISAGFEFKWGKDTVRVTYYHFTTKLQA